MMARHAGAGRVDSLFLRPGRRLAVETVGHVSVTADGLDGDHGRAGKRAVTLIQAEHLPVVAALLRHDHVDPARLRRNIVVSGINLLGLRHHEIRIGSAILLITGPCPPCSRMEEELGHGGYSAMRGHGGVYAEVTSSGEITVGASVTRNNTAS